MVKVLLFASMFNPGAQSQMNGWIYNSRLGLLLALVNQLRIIQKAILQNSELRANNGKGMAYVPLTACICLVRTNCVNANDWKDNAVQETMENLSNLANNDVRLTFMKYLI